MKEKEQIINLLLTDFGIELHPKSDGRVEIPKYLITAAGWEDTNMVYMSSNLDNMLYVSTDSELVDDTISVAVAISNGRLRIPAGFLRKIGLNDRVLVAIHDGDGMIRMRPDNTKSEEALGEFLEKLDDDQVKELLGILVGKAAAVSNNFIPSMEIARISISQKSLPEPSLFLLEGNESNPCVFRPVANPYKFRCCWVEGKPMLVRPSQTHDKSIVLYAVPGLKRIKKEDGVAVPGFLLLDQITFGKICYIVKRKGEKTAVGRDLIFIFSPKTKVGSFKVFENPRENLDPSIIELAKLTCANPERFLSNNFDFFESGKCDLPPTTITVNTIGRTD